MNKTFALFLSLLLLVPGLLAADNTGRFAPGTRLEEPALHAPPTTSRMFVRSLPRSGSIALPATGSGSMIIWTMPARPDSPVRTRLRTPTGSVLQPADRGSVERGLRRFPLNSAETAELGLLGGAHEVVHVLSTEAAEYRLEVDVAESAGGATVIAAEPDSTLTLSTWASPLSRQAGQPIHLLAELRDGGAAIAGAVVTARLASPSGRAFKAVALSDQGDGIYSAVLSDLPEMAAGAWQVHIEADGSSASGARFARTGSAELIAERNAARLGRIRTEVAGDVLRVSVPAEMLLAGTYRLDVLIADESRNGVAWAEGVRTLTAGATTLEIDLPLSDLGATSLDQLFVDVRLLGLDAVGVAGRATLDARKTIDTQ